MVGGHGLQLDLNVAFIGTTEMVSLLLTISVEVDLVLDVLDVLLGADPGGSAVRK